jgi:hypothetical protein
MKIQKRIATYLLTLAGLVVMYWLYVFVLWLAPDFSGLPYALSKALAGVITLKLVDDLLLYEVPTAKRLKDDGTAYAIYSLGYALIIALSLYGA